MLFFDDIKNVLKPLKSECKNCAFDEKWNTFQRRLFFFEFFYVKGFKSTLPFNYFIFGIINPLMQRNFNIAMNGASECQVYKNCDSSS